MRKNLLQTISFCLLLVLSGLNTTNIKAQESSVNQRVRIADVITHGSIPYKVLTLNGGTGTVQIGDGERPITNTPAVISVPKNFIHQDILFTVTEIGANVFSGQDVKVEQITIPTTITRIQESAFARSEKLRRVIFEDRGTLRTIENEAFSGAEKLESVENIPLTLEEIKIYAFNDAHMLRDFQLREGTQLETIGEGAFVNAYELRNFFIPRTVSEIATDAFKDTKKLEAFNVHPENNHFKSIDGVLFNKSGTELIQYALAKPDADYTVPDGVTTINNSAFAKNKNIVNLNLGNTVTTVKQRAFNGMSKLETVKFPQTLVEIGRNSFAKSTKVKKIILPNNLPKLGGFTFDTLSSLELIYIGENTTRLDSGAFRGDTSKVKKVVIASENINIDPQAFSFIRRNNVEYIVKNDEVKNQLLKYNKNIANIVVKPTIEATDLLLEGEQLPPPSTSTLSVGDIIEKDSVVYKVLKVEANNVEVQVGDGENPVAPGQTNLTIPSSFTHDNYTVAVKQVGRKAFSSASSVTSLTLPEGLEKIAVEAFVHNNKIQELTLPNTVVEIGAYAFQNATGLRSITLSNNLKTIRPAAFEYVPNLTELHIPDSVNNIGSGGLSNLVGLKKLFVGMGMQNIGHGFINGRFLNLEIVRFANPDITLEAGSVPAIEELTKFNVIVTSKKAQEAVMENLDLDQNRVYVENERRTSFFRDNVIVELNPNETINADTISVVKPRSYSNPIDKSYIIDVYDVDVVKMNWEKVPITQPATLKLPIQSGKKPIKAFYLENDYTSQELPFVIEGNYVILTVDHFSKYAVGYEKPGVKPGAPINPTPPAVPSNPSPTPAVPSNTNSNTTVSTSVKSLPTTGVKQTTDLGVLFILLSTGLFLYSKKRK